jgi:nicotinamide mononucleotide adenylyltransferase
MEYLAEELMLLALDDEKGHVLSAASSALPYGLMGAVLMELVLQGKLDTEAGKLVVVDVSSTGDDFLDGLLNEIATTQRRRNVRSWMRHFMNKHRGLKTAVLRNLVNQGILRHEEQRELWIFPVQRYPLVDCSVKQAMVNRVRRTVLESRTPDSRMAALISLIKACNLTNTLFNREERREAHQQINAIAKGELVGKAVSDAVAAVQAGIMASIVVATSAASASDSSS